MHVLLVLIVVPSTLWAKSTASTHVTPSFQSVHSPRAEVSQNIVPQHQKFLFPILHPPTPPPTSSPSKNPTSAPSYDQTAIPSVVSTAKGSNQIAPSTTTAVQQTSQTADSSTPMIVGIAVGAFAFICLCAVLCFRQWQLRKSAPGAGVTAGKSQSLRKTQLVESSRFVVENPILKEDSFSKSVRY